MESAFELFTFTLPSPTGYTAGHNNTALLMPHNITFVIDALTLGGAQRSLVAMANYWAERGVRVQIIVLQNTPPTPNLKLNPRISVRTINSGGPLIQKIISLPKTILQLRAALSAERSTVFAFLDEIAVLCLISTIGKKSTIFPCERTFPGEGFSKPWDIFGSFQRIMFRLRSLLYLRAAGIVVQTDRAKAWFPAALQPKITVIPNACWQEPEMPLSTTLPKPTILGLGRLSYEKGFDILIDAFSLVSAKYPDWQLAIFGTGPEAARLIKKVAAYGLGDRVRFYGATASPRAALTSADIFVLPSRFEGFPVALTEALQGGCPIIASDCFSGPREILEGGTYGLLVPPNDPQAMATAIAALITDPEKGQNLRALAKRRAQDFQPDAVMALWGRLLS